MNAMDQPHVCEHCGGTHFYQAEFRQYAVGHYASSPGGDLHPIGGMPQVILICICGWPKSPNIGGIRGGRTASGEIANFLDSLKKAQAFLGKNPVDAFRGEVDSIVNAAVIQASSELALKADVDALSQQCKTVTQGIIEDVGALGEKLEQVTQAVTAPPPAPEPPVKQPVKVSLPGRKNEPGA